jgi:hypothetical protein
MRAECGSIVPEGEKPATCAIDTLRRRRPSA